MASVSHHTSAQSLNTHNSAFYPLWDNKQQQQHLFNGLCIRAGIVPGKTDLDFTESSESEWQWHQLGHMQDYTLLQTDNDTSTSTTVFLQTGSPSCQPTNSVNAPKAQGR